MFSIQAASLHRMFEQVTPHMADDENYIPVISSVRLEVRDGWLYAVATDRFTIGVSRRMIAHDREVSAHFPAASVRTLTAWLEQVADESGDVTISFRTDPEDDGPIVFNAHPYGKLEVPYTAGPYTAFPDWRKIFRDVLTAEQMAVPVSGVTTKYLARWEHAADKLLTWQCAPRKPIVFLDLLGEFAGMQMPINNDVADREGLGSQWLEATKRRSTVDGVVYDLDATWADQHGDPWTYSGKDTPDGMPLMVLDGIDDDPHPLDRLVWTYGPLQAVGL